LASVSINKHLLYNMKRLLETCPTKLMYHCCCKGFVIVGEDNTGKLDLGIFIASIVPDGPADKDGRIRPGKILTLFPHSCQKKQTK